ILVDNRDVLDRLVIELLEQETLDKAQVAEVFRTVRKQPEREIWLSSSSRPVSDRPPVPYPTPNGANGSSANGKGSSNGHAGHGAQGDPDHGDHSDHGEPEPTPLPPVDEGRVE